MPNIVGLSYETAKKRLEEAGFFMHAVGTSTFYSNTSKAESQSVAAGEPRGHRHRCGRPVCHRHRGWLRRHQLAAGTAKLRENETHP